MKRVLEHGPLTRWARSIVSLSSLAQTQAALKKGQHVSAAAAMEFTRYCGFAQHGLNCEETTTVTRRSGRGSGKKASGGALKLEKQLLSDFAHIQDTLKSEAETHASREASHSDSATTNAIDLPVFLAAFDNKKSQCALYSVASDKVLTSGAVHARTGGAWELSDEIMSLTKGAPQFILVPIVETEKDRKTISAPFEALTAQLRACGLQPVSHVDTMTLRSALVKDAPPLHKVVSQASGVGKSALEKLSFASLEWFRARWVYLRTLACQSSTADPIHTISTLVLPRHSVFVVHLVRAGSRSMNISLYEPARRRRYANKGMLSDILACLFETRSKNMILIPTNRTDRALLYRCRTALRKVGSDTVITFASDVDEKYRKAYSSDPAKYWSAMKEITKTLDADLLFQFHLVSGNAIREHRTQVVNTTEVGGGRGSAEGTDVEEETAGAANDAIVTQTNVEAWLRQFSVPARREAERSQTSHYQRFLVISYTAGNVVDRGQPSNPLSPLNYIIAACLQDAAGHVLEPWTKYSRRGDFTLPSLASYDVLVIHDAKHFLAHQWQDKELRLFLQRGGRVWCTMLAEYLLSAQRHRTGHLSLGEIAIRYGHVLPPQTKIGSSNAQLSLSFLRNHLVMATPALVTVFQEQVRAGVERSQMISLAHRMDSLLAMTAMEVAGIFIDVQEADRQAKTWKTAAVTLDRALDAYTPMEIPIDMRKYFDWHSLTHTHAYFFGGTVAIGQGTRARHSALWTSNLIHLCHAFGPFSQMVGEVHLQQYASQCRLSFQGNTKLPQAISDYITGHGSDKTKTYRIVLFDLETTGLNVFTDEIVEVAFYDPVEKSSFTSLVRPSRRITPRTTGIHHITDEMVQDAPTMETVTAEIVKYLRLDKAHFDPNVVTVMIGHNVFGLDEPMLRRAMDQYAADLEHDGLLYCDSIVLLQALKQDMRAASGSGRRIDQGLLDVLTSTLRLGSLVERLHIRAEGPMHRAETDTKALWFVLLTALGLTGKSPAAQRDAVLKEAARSLLTYPSAGCFVPTARKATALQVRLPGVAHEALASTKAVRQLAAKPVSDETLKTLHTHGVAVAGLLLQRQRLQQHATSFLQPSAEGAMTTVHADHAVHQHIEMTTTTTSRTTSLYPSCQNIPKDDKSSARRLFVSRFGAKGRCVEVDYSQLEIVVLAILCRDKNLTKDLNNGVDFHIKRAAFFSGLPYEEIAEGYARRVPKYVSLRKKAKQFSFQRLYGAGIPLLHKTTGISPKDLEASIARENKEYPGIALFHQLIRSVALRPNNPGLPTGLIAEMPTGLQLNFRSRDVVLNLPPMKNYPIQGYGAELAQIMVGRLLRRFLETQFYKERAYLINFVHDSVWLDCHVDVLAEVVADTCRILSDVHRYIPATFPGVSIDVPLHVAASCGVNMCAMQDIDSERPSLPKVPKATASLPKQTKGAKKTSKGRRDVELAGEDEMPDDAEDADDAVKRLLNDFDLDVSTEVLENTEGTGERLIVHL